MYVAVTVLLDLQLQLMDVFEGHRGADFKARPCAFRRVSASMHDTSIHKSLTPRDDNSTSVERGACDKRPSSDVTRCGSIEIVAAMRALAAAVSASLDSAACRRSAHGPLRGAQLTDVCMHWRPRHTLLSVTQSCTSGNSRSALFVGRRRSAFSPRVRPTETSRCSEVAACVGDDGLSEHSRTLRQVSA